MTLQILNGARPPYIDQILDDSWPQWGDGLSRRAYGQYNAAQMQTPWGRSHLARVAFVESGRLLASAKRYRFSVRLDGRDGAEAPDGGAQLALADVERRHATGGGGQRAAHLRPLARGDPRDGHGPHGHHGGVAQRQPPGGQQRGDDGEEQGAAQAHPPRAREAGEEAERARH